MANNNTCIICDGKAGSREHVFPAAFGGRREDKGIYCHVHNQEFGRHVSALLDQLDVFNAIVGVRPDRKDFVRPAPATSTDGKIYMVAKGTVDVPIPPNIDSTSDSNAPAVLQFPSQRDADRWMTEQRKRGYEVRGKSEPTQTQFFTEPLHVKKCFGEPKFMRALLYLGLTYLAHHFPNSAKSGGLDAVKDELQVDGDVELAVSVWWERPESLDQLPTNPFRYGHCVVVAIDDKGQASALISLWGALQFGMVLGEVEQLGPVRAVTFIDPLADRPPNDIEVHVEEGKGLNLGSKEAGQAYLADVAAGRAPDLLQRLVTQASASELRESSITLHEKLVEAMALPAAERSTAILKIVEGESQRVLNLIHSAIKEFSTAVPLPETVKVQLWQLCTADSNRPTGLSEATEVHLRVVTAHLAAEIERQLQDGVLNVEAVELLIQGGPGTAIALNAFVIPSLMEAFDKSASES